MVLLKSLKVPDVTTVERNTPMWSADTYFPILHTFLPLALMYGVQTCHTAYHILCIAIIWYRFMFMGPCTVNHCQ